MRGGGGERITQTSCLERTELCKDKIAVSNGSDKSCAVIQFLVKSRPRLIPGISCFKTLELPVSFKSCISSQRIFK